MAVRGGASAPLSPSRHRCHVMPLLRVGSPARDTLQPVALTCRNFLERWLTLFRRGVKLTWCQ